MNNKESDIKKYIQNIVEEENVVLFMKGDKKFPQCGFSANVVNILKFYNTSFKDINILLSKDLRNGIKEYTNWPTIPQLYVNKKFIGGSDIVSNLHRQKKLKTILKVKE